MKNSLANKKSFFFIAVSLVVSFLGFVRSFAFIKFFNFEELGLVTLVSTGSALIGFLQIGMINGGYRIISMKNEESSVKVNNAIFSYFLLLSFLLFSFFAVAVGFHLVAEPLTTCLVIFIGLCALVVNWLTNKLIGNADYRRINIANLTSAVITLASIFLIPLYGFFGAVISILMQPLSFITIVFFTGKQDIPNKFDFDVSYARYILKFGFVPYLSGVFFLVYQQLERWNVTLFLGTGALGKLYLLSLVNTLWVLIPTSINSILFPKAVRAYSESEYSKLDNVIKNYFLIIGVYCIVGGLALVFLFPWLVNVVFSNHTPYTPLVIAAIPGLTARILADPATLYLNSVVKLKAIFWSDILATVVYIVVVGVLVISKTLTLQTIVVSYNIYFCGNFLILLFAYLSYRRDLSKN